MMDSVKANIQTRRPLSSVRPQAMSFYSLLDKPGLFLRICRLRILFKTGDKIKIELAEPTLKQTGVLKTVKDSPCRPVLHHFITACRRIRIAAELSSFFILSFCHVCIRIVRRHARSIVLYSNPAATVALGCRQSLPRLWWWLGAHK